MEQKAIYLHYFLIGFSVFISIGLLNCKGEEDYVVKADFIYKNETEHTIEVIALESFTLDPGEDYSLYQEGLGAKSVTAENYVPPFLDGVIIYNNTKCDTLAQGPKPGQGEGPAGIDNYASVELDDRYYQFTYIFTESDYLLAEPCDE